MDTDNDGDCYLIQLKVSEIMQEYCENIPEILQICVQKIFFRTLEYSCNIPAIFPLNREVLIENLSNLFNKNFSESPSKKQKAKVSERSPKTK